MNLPDSYFTFGKHRGKRVSQVAVESPAYLLWVSTLWTARHHPQLWPALRAHLPRALEALEAGDRLAVQLAEQRVATRRAKLAAAGRPLQQPSGPLRIWPADVAQARALVADMDGLV